MRSDFGTRLLCIEKEIVGARNAYIQQGLIDKTKEPFSIRYRCPTFGMPSVGR